MTSEATATQSPLLQEKIADPPTAARVEAGNGPSPPRRYRWWCLHPKVKEHKRGVIIAILLLITGIILMSCGIVVQVIANDSATDVIFMIVGLIFIIPGAYFTVYAYLATRGVRGYDMDNLSYFSVGNR